MSVLPWYYMYNSVHRVSNKEIRGNTKRGEERRRKAKPFEDTLSHVFLHVTDELFTTKNVLMER